LSEWKGLKKEELKGGNMFFPVGSAMGKDIDAVGACGGGFVEKRTAKTRGPSELSSRKIKREAEGRHKRKGQVRNHEELRRRSLRGRGQRKGRNPEAGIKERLRARKRGKEKSRPQKRPQKYQKVFKEVVLKKLKA